MPALAPLVYCIYTASLLLTLHEVDICVHFITTELERSIHFLMEAHFRQEKKKKRRKVAHDKVKNSHALNHEMSTSKQR